MGESAADSLWASSSVIPVESLDSISRRFVMHERLQEDEFNSDSHCSTSSAAATICLEEKQHSL